MFFVMSSFRGRLVKSFTLSTWLAHVVFCLPGGFLIGFMKDLSIFQAGALVGKGLRWLNHVNLFLCMVILHGFISVRAYRSLLEIVLGHLTLMILLSSFIWNKSKLFSRVCIYLRCSDTLDVRCKYSYLDLFTDMLAAENRLKSLVWIIASTYCLLISSSVSSSDPRYLHFFQASSLLLSMLYLSVLLSFTCNPSVSNMTGISLLTWLFSTRLISGMKYHQHTLSQYWPHVRLSDPVKNLRFSVKVNQNLHLVSHRWSVHASCGVHIWLGWSPMCSWASFDQQCQRLWHV